MRHKYTGRGDRPGIYPRGFLEKKNNIEKRRKYTKY
jgi:hypothetical protein